jgi:hypothetical protein
MYIATDGRFKLVWAQRAQDQGHLAGRGVEHVLYDLTSDPEETVNVADRFPRELESLSKSLWSWYSAEPFAVGRDGADCQDEIAPDPETIKQLEALGYL